MPRIRTIKPEFWSSPDLAGMSMEARLTYIALWNWADDSGRGSANPRELLGFVFPNDHHLTLDGFRRVLGEIRRGFGVVFYTVRGRPYFEIPTWSQHQKIDKRAADRYPASEQGIAWDPESEQSSDQHEQDDSADSTENSVVPIEFPPRTRSEHGAGTGEQGNRGSTPCSPPRGDATSTRKPRREPERFAEFYDLYPKHKGRDAAARAFEKVIKRNVDPQDLINGAKRYRAEVKGIDPRYVKHPATWLNQGCWQDEPDAPAVGEDWRRFCEQ